MKKITIIIPCYNEERSLPLLYERLNEVREQLPQYAWEFLLVNDGSRDNTLQIMRSLRSRDSQVCYIDLSRNFGKERAMLAGLDFATGDAVIIMDADLQQPPEIIPQMLKLWEEGYEDVYARRLTRKGEPWLRRQMSQLFYKLLQRFTRDDVLRNVGDFRLLDRKCVDALKLLREHERYTKGLFVWIGYKKTEVTYEQQERAQGNSSFGFMRLLTLAVDGITSFSTAPLRISTVIGLIVSLVAFFYMCYVLIKTIILGGDPVQGFPTLIIVMLFLGGVQLLSLGIIGEYLARIFNETKNRPVYLVREKEGV
jgi:glycosyltransferase involved in cell wall biosynthesis